MLLAAKVLTLEVVVSLLGISPLGLTDHRLAGHCSECQKDFAALVLRKEQ